MKNIFEKIKANEPIYRALRTFIQAFISTAALQLAGIGPDELSKKVIFTILASAGSAALAAVMNMKKPSESNAEVLATDDNDYIAG